MAFEPRMLDCNGSQMWDLPIDPSESFMALKHSDP